MSMMRVPTLAEVLTNQASPPYTLSAFMAFLSQNHCLETLEFTLDASRYQTQYYSLAQVPPQPGSEDAENLRHSWDRLINSYIRPGAPREVNLPSFDRDFLVRIPNTYTPPSPEALDSAVYKINELMRESVLSPFLQSCHEKAMLEEKQRQLQQNSMYPDSMGMSLPYANTGLQQRPNSMYISNAIFQGGNTSNMFGSGVQRISQQMQQQQVPQQLSTPQEQYNQMLVETQSRRSSQHSDHQSGLTQLFNGRRLSRPGSTRPTSVPSTDMLQSVDSWSTGHDLDSDMSGSEDPITPPHTPPAGSSPTAGHGQWRSKIKNQFSKMNGHRSKSREPM